MRGYRIFDALGGDRVSLAHCFVEKNGGCGCGVERLNAAGHGNANAEVGGAFDFFGEAGAFVADEESDWLAPIDFPRSGFVGGFGEGRSEGADFCGLKLFEKRGESWALVDREMKRGTSGGAEGFGRKGIGSAADAGGGGGGSSGTESGGGANDRADIAGVLNACKDDEERRAGRVGSAEKIFEGSGFRFDEGGDALGVFGVGEAFEEAIGGVKNWDGDFGTVEKRSESFAMTSAGFAEEDGFDFAAGAEGLFD